MPAERLINHDPAPRSLPKAVARALAGYLGADLHFTFKLVDVGHHIRVDPPSPDERMAG